MLNVLNTDKELSVLVWVSYCLSGLSIIMKLYLWSHIFTLKRVKSMSKYPSKCSNRIKSSGMNNRLYTD